MTTRVIQLPEESELMDQAQDNLPGAPAISSHEEYKRAASALRDVDNRISQMLTLRADLHSQIIEAGRHLNSTFKAPINFLEVRRREFNSVMIEYERVEAAKVDKKND